MKKQTLVRFFIIGGDVIIFYLSLYLAIFFRKFETPSSGIWQVLAHQFSYILPFWLLFLFIFDFYHIDEIQGRKNFHRFLFHFFVLALLVGICFFYLRPDLKFTPKTILFLDVFIFTFLVMLSRVIFIGLFNLIPKTREEKYQKIDLNSLDEEKIEDIKKPRSKIYLISKRIFDLFFAVFGFMIFAVTFPFIAILIKVTSPGPIFFIQERVGKDGRVFKNYKYRSMHHNPKKEENKLWREKDKNEITSFGRFLRYTHLDELPQIINILKGDISFVGPRPEWKVLAEMYEKEIPFYNLRYLVNPGFTGWAQINYQASTSIEQAKEKLEYDLYYIKNRNFWFDVSIFLRSLKKIFG